LKETRTALEKQRGIAANWTARGAGTASMKIWGGDNFTLLKIDGVLSGDEACKEKKSVI